MANDGFMRYFTKKECYPNQREAMERIANALEKGSAVLFEGACGTGKTLSALAPALDVAERKHQIVIIVTNVHQQMVQFINEAREIHRKNPINVLVLKGKQAMCPDGLDYEECRARSENTYELIKAEIEAAKIRKDMKDAGEKFRETKDPSYREDQADLEKQLREKEAAIKKKREVSCMHLFEVVKAESPVFRTWLFDGVRSPEDISEYAAERGMCGYELLKKEMKRANLIICNYHHVLSPEIFSMLLGWTERGPDEVIVIFDEAHNIENAARSHSSVTISERVVDRAIIEIEENADKFTERAREEAQKTFMAFYDAVRETYNFKLGPNGRNRLTGTWTDIRISDPEERFDIVRERFFKKMEDAGQNTDVTTIHKKMIAVSEIGRAVEDSYRERFKSGNGPLRKSYISRTADFLGAYLLLSGNPNYYPILNVRRDRYGKEGGEIYGRMELFTCIPRDVTRELFGMLGGLVLMSATLRPFSMVKETLGIERDCTELSFGTAFPAQRRKTLAVSVPPLFSNRRNDATASNAVEFSLLAAIKATPGNVLIYFQSSAEAEKYTRFLKTALSDSIPVYADIAGTSATDVREQFFRIGENGGKAVLVSYILGTLSEGVDFRNDRARTVIVVGVGYPALNDRARAVEASYDLVFGEGTGWTYSILAPTIRRVRQAMGRVVRSPTDYGVRILLDARYQVGSVRTLGKYSVVDSFPDDEKCEIEDIRPIDIEKTVSSFFETFKNDVPEKDDDASAETFSFLRADKIENDNSVEESGDPDIDEYDEYDESFEEEQTEEPLDIPVLRPFDRE